MREKSVMCKVVSIDRNTTNNKLKFRCLDTKGCCGSCSTGRPRVTEKGVSTKDHIDQTVLWAYVHGELSGLPRLMGKIQPECWHHSLAWGPEKAGGTLRMRASSLCS